MREHHRVGHVGFDGAGDQVARDDAARASVNHHQVQHFGARKHRDAAGIHLAFERLISAQQKLLAGLAARVKRSRNLRAAETAIGERASVFARERNALRHALVDDVDADLRQPVNVGFAGAEIAALYGVVEQAIDAVAVVLIILRGVDAALRGDRMRAARRILKAEAFDVDSRARRAWPRPTRRPVRCPPR